MAAAALFSARPASAHPHVWVTMHSEILFSADGAVTGVRHAWTFDDMFSAFALQGYESKVKGVYTREELAPLAEVNISSLKEYDYFTYATADGTKLEFADPTDYWLEQKDGALVLHFILPLTTPVAVKKLDLEVFDPSIFVDFAFAKTTGADKPVTLVGAPGCAVKTALPKGLNAADAKRLSQIDKSDSVPPDMLALGQQFANKITVTCP